jgi:hypothetical protein
MHSFSFQQNSKNITIPIKTDREYPRGVDFIVTCRSDDIYYKKRINVISEQLIKSLTVSPQPILKGRSGIGTIILNRADLAGSSTIVTLTNLSEPTKAYVEIDDKLIIPINQTTGSFRIKIDPTFPGSKFFLKAQIPSGSSKSIEVKIGE